VIALFLDPDDERHFRADNRRSIHGICIDTEPKNVRLYRSGIFIGILAA